MRMGATGAARWGAPPRRRALSASTRVVGMSARYSPLAVPTTPSQCQRPPRSVDNVRPRSCPRRDRLVPAFEPAALWGEPASGRVLVPRARTPAAVRLCSCGGSPHSRQWAPGIRRRQESEPPQPALAPVGPGRAPPPGTRTGHGVENGRCVQSRAAPGYAHRAALPRTRRGVVPPGCAHKDPDLRNTRRTQGRDHALVCGAVFPNSCPCVRHGRGWPTWWGNAVRPVRGGPQRVSGRAPRSSRRGWWGGCGRGRRLRPRGTRWRRPSPGPPGESSRAAAIPPW